VKGVKVDGFARRDILSFRTDLDQAIGQHERAQTRRAGRKTAICACPSFGRATILAGANSALPARCAIGSAASTG
jgi:hypothetical protein